MKNIIAKTTEEKYELELLRKEVLHLDEIGIFYLSQLLDNKEYGISTKDKDNKIVAGCYFHRLENTLMIDQLFVKKECQNKGIGKKLINNLFVNKEKLEKLLGDKINVCRISSNNEKAKTIYKKMGFRESRLDSDSFIKPMM